MTNQLVTERNVRTLKSILLLEYVGDWSVEEYSKRIDDQLSAYKDDPKEQLRVLYGMLWDGLVYGNW